MTASDAIFILGLDPEGVFTSDDVGKAYDREIHAQENIRTNVHLAANNKYTREVGRAHEAKQALLEYLKEKERKDKERKNSKFTKYVAVSDKGAILWNTLSDSDHWARSKTQEHMATNRNWPTWDDLKNGGMKIMRVELQLKDLEEQ